MLLDGHSESASTTRAGAAPRPRFPLWLLIAIAFLVKHVAVLRLAAVRLVFRRLRIADGPGRRTLETLACRVSRQLSPRAAAGFLRVVSAESAVGATMPRTFFISITNKCNLRCKQCYAAGWDRRTSLTEGQVEKAVSDCHASGVDIFTLLGGEPFTRKRLIFSLLERHPNCLFMINSNGLLITDDVADRLAALGNVVVHLSLEGGAERTDSRRGDGTYRRVFETMSRLRQRGVPFDVTAMVTAENKEEIFGSHFVREVLEQGALAIWYTCYRPVGGEHDGSLVVPYDARVELFEKIVRMRNRLPIMLFDNQFDNTLFGGCFASNGFNTHLNSYGCLEPCPAMHYSTDNLLSGEQSVPELYSRSRLLRGVRGLHDPARVQCPITDRTGDLLRVLRETGAADSTGGRDLGALERFEARSSSCACRSLASMPVLQNVYGPIKLKLLGHLFGERAAADLASAPPPNLESHSQSEDRLGPPPSPRGSNVGRT